jgi:hypothetical protein
MAKNELFDVIDAMFSKEKWKLVPKRLKEKHFHELLSTISKGHPMEVMKFNHTNINKALAADIMAANMARKYSRPPAWRFAAPKPSDPDKQCSSIEPKVITQYAVDHELVPWQVKDLIELFDEEFHAELVAFRKTLKD